ncbi:MAG: hypothetical protein JXR03_06440 [Cyclobacteriaceae bacterium]
MNFIEKYGYCVVPKGTILLRSGESFEYNNCMFFGLDSLVGGCFARDKMQAWEVIEDFELLFMVKHVARPSRVISSIVEIYRSKYPDEKSVDDLDIKQRDLRKRECLFKILRRQSVIGWLSSLEDNPALEICLFSAKSYFEKVIRPLGYTNDEEYESHNALNQIEIYPSRQFYENSKSICGSFEKYEKYWLENYGGDELNLRVKLRV